MNYGFAAVQTVYLAALGVWVWGDLLLGAMVLPSVFGFFADRSQAGELASTLLRRFAYVKWACLAAVAGSAALRFWLWEQWSPFIKARHAALALLAVTFLFNQLLVAPRLERLRPQLAGAPAEAPVRSEFAGLHRLSVSNGLVGAAAGLVALFLS